MELVRYPPDALKKLPTWKSPWVLHAGLAVIVVCAALALVAFLTSSEAAKTRRLEAERAQMDSQLRSDAAHIQQLSAELAALSARMSAPVALSVRSKSKGSQSRSTSSASVSPISSSRVQQATVPSLAPQQIDSHVAQGNTEPAVTNTYAADLKTLNGSVATTHEQLLRLEQQGARHYLEFQLSRTKEFKEISNLWVQLRKVDPRHSNYSLSIIVDGHRIEKSHINLFEPIWIASAENPMQYQFVANAISATQISGYLSEPKFSKATPRKASQAAARVKPAPGN